jgi:hypothetical protein
MGPPLRLINRHNRHSKIILSVTKQRRFIPRLEVGRPHLEGRPHLPTAIPAKTDARNRPSTVSGARIRSVQVKRRWIIGSAAPLDLAVPMEIGSRPQPNGQPHLPTAIPSKTDARNRPSTASRARIGSI